MGTSTLTLHRQAMHRNVPKKNNQAGKRTHTCFVTCDLQGKTDDSIDDKASESLDGGVGNGGDGVVVRVLVDGDREDTERGPTLGEGKNLTGQEEKEKPGPKAGKSKRKRPANRCAQIQHVCNPYTLYT